MRVVINRSDAIGDTILTLPIARKIKKHHPESEVVFMVGPLSSEVVKNCEYVDDVWVYNRKWSFVKKLIFLWRKFRSFRPDTYFFVGGDHLPSFVAFIRRVTFRGGLKSKWPSFLFLNNGVRQSRSMVTMHESEYNLNLLSPLNLHYDQNEREELTPGLTIGQTERERSLNDLKQLLGWEEFTQYIVIHPGMTGHTLNWPARNYARLIARLDKHFSGKYRFVVSYTPSDEKYLEGIRHYLLLDECREVTKRVTFYDGSVKGLRTYLTLLSAADLYVGPSTGPTHLANAIGTKVVTFYSPIKVQSAARWAPYQREPERTRILIPDVICGEQFKCAGDGCPYYECMAKIEVDDAFREAVFLLQN